MIFQLALLILAAYVVGATPFGFLMGKAKGYDIRDHGSGNIGATNVVRIVGKKEGILVFVLDVLKGLVPVLVGTHFAEDIMGEHAEYFLSSVSVLIALAAIMGHNYTFWLNFRGGKGVATSGGAMTALMPWAVLAAVVVWLVVFYAKRYVALASIFAAVTIPVTVAVQGIVAKHFDEAIVVLAIVVAVMGVWRHRANIERMRAGTENRMGRKKPEPDPEES